MTSPAALSRAPARAWRSPATPLAAALMSGGLVAGLIVGQLVVTGHLSAVAALALVFLPVVLWKLPHLAPVVIVVAALSIEQFQPMELATAGGTGLGAVDPAAQVPLSAQIPITPHIPLFHGLGALHLSPADLLIAAALVLYLVRVRPRSRWWPRSSVAVAMLGLVVALVAGIAVGAAHHGSLRVALMEVRPYAYLVSTYFLTSVLVTNRTALRAVLWGTVVATGLKAVQGLVVFLSIRHMQPRPEAVLGHEEAFFFALFIFLALSLWLFDVPGRLRTTATWLLPLVIAVDLANNRRSAWLVVGGGLIVLAAVAMRSLPARRRVLTRVIVVALVLSAVYFPLYWNHTGGLALPARALQSAVDPHARDAASDLYREQEDANLKVNIQEGGLLGRGFGVAIDYPLPIADITNIDPLVAYIPHNGVLYVPMRLGLVGAIAFWALLAAGIVNGCRLARSTDRELALVGGLVVCALVGYVLAGAVDQGFFFYRIAFVVGVLLGLAEAARRLGSAA